MRRCRHCKEHHIPKDAPASQWWGNDACKRAYTKAKFAAKSAVKSPKVKPAKKQLKSIAKLVDDAAVLLQKLVRMKAADASGYCRCVTCSAPGRWQDLQGGHFIERNRIAVKLMEENCHPQCQYCNGFAMKTTSGVLAYRSYMGWTYGEQFVQELIQQSKQVKKYTRHEVEGMIFDFKRQIQQQEERLSGSTKTESAAA